MQTKVVQVAGMSCDHCKRAVERVLCDVPGIEEAVADVSSGQVTIRMRENVSDTVVRMAVEEAGYTVQD